MAPETAQVDIGEYQYGFSSPETPVFKTRAGLDEDVVREISAHKNEPQWMLDFRLKAYATYRRKPMPTWGGDLSGIDFESIFYYLKPTEENARSWDDVPDDIKNTFDRLGIPEAEKKFLAGVGAQYESEVIYHSLQKDLEDKGVIFLDTDQALQKHEDLFREHWATIIPPTDNVFAALNSAVWSGGSFIYVPPGVKVELPLQAYFRINAQNMGQFERTLIIVDEGAYVHYVEGCTAPTYSSDSLHSAVVEIVVKKGGRCRYTTIQNWSNNVYNLVTKRAVAYQDATMEWVDGNLGSKLTMKYPAVILKEPGAHGEVLSIAFAGEGQHQDAGAKITHMAPNTTSVITSKSISRGGGRASYRGLLRVNPGAKGAKSKVVCDALILDEDSRSDTYPYINIGENEVDIGHEATVSKLGEEQLFYLRSRGLSESRGRRDDRRRLRRADHEGAAARVRGRDEPPDPAADGRLGRLMAAWLEERRNEARAALASTPLPTLKDENWRYTSLRGIDFDAFATVAGERRGIGARRPRCSAISRPRASSCSAASDVVHVRLDDEVRAAGVVLSSLTDAVESHGELVDRHLGSVLDLRDRFIAENSATWSGGAFVYVPAGVTVGTAAAARRREPRGGRAHDLAHARGRRGGRAPDADRGAGTGRARLPQRRARARARRRRRGRPRADAGAAPRDVPLQRGTGRDRARRDAALVLARPRRQARQGPPGVAPRRPRLDGARDRHLRARRAPAPRSRHLAGARRAERGQRPRLQGRAARPRALGLARDHQGRAGRAGHGRLPGEPQPAALGPRARRLDPGPPDPRQRRALHACGDGQPGRSRSCSSSSWRAGSSAARPSRCS